MKVQVYVHPVEGKDNFIGYIDAIVNGEIMIHDIKLMNGQYGLFVDMPARQNLRTQQWEPHVTGISKEFRNALIEACNKALKSNTKEASVGEKGNDLYYKAHFHEVNKNNLIGFARLTVSEKHADKSMFTIQNISVHKNEKIKSALVDMPSKMVAKEDAKEYRNLITFSSTNTEYFVKNIVRSAMNKDKATEKK